MATKDETAYANELLAEIGFPVPASATKRQLAEAIKNFQHGWSFGFLRSDGEPGEITLAALEECRDRDGACSPHFHFDEFACHGTAEVKVDRELILGLEQARVETGGTRLKITSGYRSPTHNRKVGGSKTSKHMSGQAADVELPSIQTVKSWGLFTGIGAELSTGRVMHVDVRDGDPGKPTMWTYLDGGGRGRPPQEWLDYPVVGNGPAALKDWKPGSNGKVQTKAKTKAKPAARRSGSRLNLGPLMVFVDSKGMAKRGTLVHLERIVDACFGAQLSEPQMAYVLATALAESKMGSVMTEKTSGAEYEGDATIGNVRNGDGRKYKGRGYAQIRGRAKYLKLTRLLRDLGHDVDLIAEPAQAVRPGIAAVILVQGMKQGEFTGRNLARFVNDDMTDFEGARQVINGRNRAKQVAGYAEGFLQAIRS